MHLLFTQVHFSSDSPAGSEVNTLQREWQPLIPSSECSITGRGAYILSSTKGIMFTSASCLIFVKFPTHFFSERFVSVFVVYPVVLRQVQLGRNPALFCREDKIFMLLISCPHSTSSSWRTSLSINEVFLPKSENLSSNFRGLWPNVVMSPLCLKHASYFICVRVDANTSCCLLQAIEYRFGSRRYIYKKRAQSST